MCNFFLYSLEPALHKQTAMKTSEDARRKEDVSETKRRTLLNTVFGVASELECTLCVLKVMAQTVCLSSLHPVLFYDTHNNISEQELGWECESRADGISNNCYALNCCTGCQKPDEAKAHTVFQKFFCINPLSSTTEMVCLFLHGYYCLL